MQHMTDDDIRRDVLAALRKRDENGGQHLHHRDCIHNLPPAEQIAMRGKTVEWWKKVIGSLPTQITPDDWQTEPPEWSARITRSASPTNTPHG